MKIGLVDVDGHNFPNLALMRISQFYKLGGHQVEWWMGDLFHYDIVYKSKVFSFSEDVEVHNADQIIQGGTGYAISLIDGKEVYNKELDSELPSEIEKMRPDYSIYPEHDFAVSMTSRGCPRGCQFCHVAPKEGRCSHKVANVEDFYQGQKEIQVLDPNITACKDKRELFRQYKETNALIVFNQGLDIRLLNEEDIYDLNTMRVKDIHFAWDNPKDDLLPKFQEFAKQYRHTRNGQVYVLTNFNSTMEENLYRIYKLYELNYYPYVMIYDKEHAPEEVKRLQRWCNNRFIFKSCKFEEFI